MRKLMVFMAAMGILFLSGCTDNTESSISKDSVSEIESSAVQEVPPEESVDLEESPLPDAVVPDPLKKWTSRFALWIRREIQHRTLKRHFPIICLQNMTLTIRPQTIVLSTMKCCMLTIQIKMD